MSVLIKDMVMPETCDDCPFHVYYSHYEFVCKATPMLYHMNLENTKGIRKEWCPLSEVPPAQPERTCVNCGRTANNGGWYADGGTRCPIEEHYALPKDGFCHLWEKRNVTDDDYPERRTDGRD